MNKDYGTVTFDGKLYTLTQDAYADNYENRTCYFACAEDADGEGYRVRWETTIEWDEREAAYVASDYDPWFANEDEANACDWENPVEVITI